MSELFEKSIRTLELPRVLQLLSDQAVSAEAKERALRVSPETEPGEVLCVLDQTDAARQMIGLRGAPSFSGVKPVAETLDRADRGGSLNARELLRVAGLLTAARRARGNSTTPPPRSWRTSAATCGPLRPRAARSSSASSPPPAIPRSSRRASSPSGTAGSWCR